MKKSKYPNPKCSIVAWRGTIGGNLLRILPLKKSHDNIKRF